MKSVDFEKLIIKAIEKAGKELYIPMLKNAMEEANKERQPTQKTIQLINELSSKVTNENNRQDKNFISLKKDVESILEKISVLADNSKNGCLVHSQSVEKRFNELEDKIEENDRRIKEMKEWQSEINGGKKVIIGVASFVGVSNIGLVILALINYLNK